ncbi:MAG: LptF/LptG family permease [Candidatus Binatia bacterium]
MSGFAWINSLLQPSPLCSGRLGPILSNYVIREIATISTFSLLAFTVLALSKDLVSFSDFVINRGFGIPVVLWITIYETIPILTRVLPFAVLIGVLISLGKMRARLEIVAMENGGIAKQRLLGPVLAFATLVMTVELLLTLFCSPWATRSLDLTLRRLAAQNPGLVLQPNIVHEFHGAKIVAREVSPTGDHLRGVLVWAPAHGQILFAERGEILPQRNNQAQLLLYDGLMLPDTRERGEATHFKTFQQILQEKPLPIRHTDTYIAGLSFAHLATVAWYSSANHDIVQQAQREWHHRLAYPFASLCFGLLAVPLVLAGQRFSGAAGGVTGLVVTVLYYGLLQLGTGLIQTGATSVVLGVWLPNTTITLLGLSLLGQQTFPVWHRYPAATQPEPLPRHQDRSLGHPRRYILQRYVIRQYLMMLGLSFTTLLTGYFLIDLLERLQWFAKYETTFPHALQFYSLWLRVLASRVVPMAVLLATALTVSVLSARNELTGLRACGVSAIRGLSPILAITGLVAMLYFVLNETLLPQIHARVDSFKSYEIKKHAQAPTSWEKMIWWREDTQVYCTDRLDLQRLEAHDLTIYDLDANGLPRSRIDARTARYVGNGMWELVDPVRTEISTQGLRQTPSPSRLQLGDTPHEVTSSSHLSVWELANAVRETEAKGYEAKSLRVDLHMKYAAPVACLLLPTVALLFAISGPPFATPAVTLLVSIGLGVSYMVLSGLLTALGYGSFLPPSIAGWLLPVSLSVAVIVLAKRLW